MIIKVKLSPSGIKKAQSEVRDYKRRVDAKLTEFIRRLSAIGLNVAQARFSTALYDGVNDVTVYVEQDGTKAYIIAEGSAVAFIEFGTGVAFPEHGSGLFKHGSYGSGKGSNPNGWVYNGSPGTGGMPLYDRKGNERSGVYRTKGNPPAEAMWTAVTEMAAQITQVWREVMGGD